MLHSMHMEPPQASMYRRNLGRSDKIALAAASFALKRAKPSIYYLPSYLSCNFILDLLHIYGYDVAISTTTDVAYCSMIQLRLRKSHGFVMDNFEIACLRH